jgi:hypothetical protein
MKLKYCGNKHVLRREGSGALLANAAGLSGDCLLIVGATVHRHVARLCYDFSFSCGKS